MPQACVAALAAAGGLVLKVVTILLELCLSLPPARNVFNMPPFFSGLGVLELLPPTGLPGMTTGGARVDEEKVADVDCRGEPLDRGTSVPELFLEGYDGLVAPFLVGNGGGRASCW